LRQPEAAAPPAEARAVRRDTGLDLQADAGVRGKQRQHGVCRRARPAHVRRERAKQAIVERLETIRDERVVARGALELRRRLVLSLRAKGLGVEAVGLGAHLAREREEALRAPRRLELVGE